MPPVIDDTILQPVNIPARNLALDPQNAAQIAVLRKRNQLIAGVVIPKQSRASQYRDPRLKIIESVAAGHTWTWKVNALAALVDEERDRQEAVKKAKAAHIRRIAAKKAKRAATKLKVAQRKKKGKTERSPHARKRSPTPPPNPFPPKAFA